jgi:4-amino-4-deoxy-L-arabinose transferase-like glycosyltransferase
MGLAVISSPEVRRRLLGLRWALGLAIVILVSVPWFWYMYRRFGQDFIQGYALDENISLYAANRFGNKLDPAFYLRILAAGLLPWTGLLLGRIADDIRAAYARWTQGSPIAVDGVEVLLWSWTAAIVGFFSLSTFKLDHYVFPAAPALCLLCARAWSDVRATPAAEEHRWTRLGRQLIGPFLVAIGIAGAYVLLARLQLPAGAILVPGVVGAAGLLIAARVGERDGRAPRVPWIALGALAVALAGVLVFVMPALESQKVVPDVARWIASHAGPNDRIASYRLNRWNTAFRFYVDRHTSVLETPEEAEAFFRGGGPFYGVLLEPAFEELKARGLPLRKVYVREGLWATAGRALWRRAPAPTRFVVVTGP